jgi:hypothetical protein
MKTVFLVTSIYKSTEEWHELNGVALTEDAAYKEACRIRKEVIKTLRTPSPIKGFSELMRLPKDTPKELRASFKEWLAKYTKARAFKKCIIEEMEVL